MPRKNENARSTPKAKKSEKRYRAVLVPFNRHKAENMSPGRLVAVAEWRLA